MVRVIAATLLGCLVAAGIQGCGVVTAPGFDYADPKIRTSITLGQDVSRDGRDTDSVIPINAALIRAQEQAKPREIPAQVARLFASPTAYTIGPSDIISIVVYDHPELLPNAGTVINQAADPTGVASAPGFIVNADGQVFFPFVGRVSVSGLTEIEAAELLRDKLARYIRNPQVTVRITSFRSRRAYVDGEVRSAGTQVFTDIPMTLAEALNRAGGITAAGDRSSVALVRDNEVTTIDLLQLQELGVNPNKILLKSGDLVTVRSRDESKVYVLGEIARPSALQMRNGRLSLNDALGEAGGPTLNTANTAQVYVIRQQRDAAPKIFHLDAKSPAALALAEGFRLAPKDVVYIDPVPLVSWNRIISLILPSAQGVTATRQALTP